MSLEQILSRIREETVHEIEKVQAEERERSKSIELSAQKTAEAEAAKILTAANAEAAEITKRAETLARLESRKANLAGRQATVDQAFAAAEAALASMPQDRYGALLEAAIASAVESGTEQVLVRDRDLIMVNGIVKKVNDARRNQGQTGDLIVAASPKVGLGGVIVVNGPVQTNLTFERILHDMHDDLVPEAAAILFPGMKS
jgi:vacuolar-type H+-ATPase subunit E/Vma4